LRDTPHSTNETGATNCYIQKTEKKRFLSESPENVRPFSSGTASFVLQTQVRVRVRVKGCPERLSNSQAVSLIQHVLMTLVLRLIMNDGFSFDFSIACSEFFRVSWVNRW